MGFVVPPFNSVVVLREHAPKPEEPPVILKILDESTRALRAQAGRPLPDKTS